MKTKLDKTKLFIKPEYWMEIISWIVMILVLIFIRFMPNSSLDNTMVYMFIGGIISFIIIYYFVIHRYFSRTQRLWIKDISDIIVISVLIIIAGNYGTYLFALYFIPIAAATLVLGTINSLLIALIACIFVIFDIFMGSQGYFPTQTDFTLAAVQIAFIVFITIFCWFLAIEVREEKRARAKAESLAMAKEISEKREREFMTMTSHQLMTPLSIIRGFASILRSDQKKRSSSKQHEFIEEIYSNSKKMVALVNELMTASKIRADQEQFKIELLPLEPIINNVVAELESVAESKKTTIKFNKPKEKIPDVLIDPDKLEQAITNLVDNAIKYSDKGEIYITCSIGHITKEQRNRETEERRDAETEKLKNKEKEVVVSVADTGAGISKEDQAKVFTPFFRSKKTFGEQGTGLGLYITKMIIEKHGGRIWFTSESGKGSVFSFSLPIKKS